jgi:hypothetical protein
MTRYKRIENQERQKKEKINEKKKQKKIKQSKEKKEQTSEIKAYQQQEYVRTTLAHGGESPYPRNHGNTKCN